MTETLAKEIQVSWQEKGKLQQAVWQSEANAAPPKNIIVADDTMKADEAYRLACEGTGFLYINGVNATSTSTFAVNCATIIFGSMASGNSPEP